VAGNGQNPFWSGAALKGTAMIQYDIFVSYSQQDLQLARDIVNGLKAAGFKIWFDQDLLRPGDLWMDGLAKGIAESQATVILIGQDGLTPWIETEARQALQDAVKRHHRIIPVLLPAASGETKAIEALPFLNQRQIVNSSTFPVSQHIVEQVIWGISGRKPVSHMTQIGQEFALTLPRPDQSQRTLRVYTLPNSEPNNLLWLSWHTFGACVERLAEQLRNYGWRLNADACIGINDAGLAMATFLGGAVLDRPKLGYMRYQGPGVGDPSFLDGSVFPELRKSPTILLADFELKTGKGLSEVCSRLKQQYQDPNVFLAVCGALVRTPDLIIDGIDKLEAFSCYQEAGVRDLFVAATMGSPGIEPPLGLR
jgi:hypothetical protein